MMLPHSRIVARIRRTVIASVLSIVVAIAGIPTYAMADGINHVDVFGGSEPDVFLGAVKTSTSASYDSMVVVGYSDSVDGDMDGLSKGSRDAVIQYIPGSSTGWTKIFGGSGNEEFRSIGQMGGKSVVFYAVGVSTSNDGDMEGLAKGIWMLSS